MPRVPGGGSGDPGAFIAERLIGPAIAGVVYLPLHVTGLVAPVPVWWFYAWLGLGTALTLATQWNLDDPGSAGHLHGRLAAQTASISGIIYLTGYGPAIALLYLKTLVDNLGRGSWRVLASSLGWTALGMGLGQAALAGGMVPSLIPFPEVHALAVVSFVGVTFVSWLIVDTARRRARTNARLRRREKDLSLLVTSIEGRAILRLDPHGRVATWNRGAELIYGYEAEEIVGRHLSCFYPPDEREAGVPERHLDEALQRGSLEYEGWRLRKDGSRYWASVVITPLFEDDELIGFGKVIEDRTERKELEAKLVQASKMRASGQMARALVHDLGNFVLALRGFARELTGGLPSGSPEHEAATQVAAIAERVEKLVTQLRAFGSQQELEPEMVEVNELIADARPLLEQLVSHDVTVTLSLDENVERIRVDPGKLRQALMNLVLNAGEAMPDGGEIVILTRNIDDEMDSGLVGTPPPHPGVRITVRDTGVGMDEETRMRAFDAFFTTKGADGTGLGLSTVYGFVSQSGGTVHVLSEPGQGSTFHCCFPKPEVEPVQSGGHPVRRHGEIPRWSAQDPSFRAGPVVSTQRGL